MTLTKSVGLGDLYSCYLTVFVITNSEQGKEARSFLTYWNSSNPHKNLQR